MQSSSRLGEVTLKLEKSLSHLCTLKKTLQSISALHLFFPQLSLLKLFFFFFLFFMHLY